MPPTELPLFTFASAEHLKQWNVFTDAEAGGSTNAKFENILNARGQANPSARDMPMQPPNVVASFNTCVNTKQSSA